MQMYSFRNKKRNFVRNVFYYYKNNSQIDKKASAQGSTVAFEIVD